MRLSRAESCLWLQQAESGPSPDAEELNLLQGPLRQQQTAR